MCKTQITLHDYSSQGCAGLAYSATTFEADASAVGEVERMDFHVDVCHVCEHTVSQSPALREVKPALAKCARHTWQQAW